MTFAIALVVAGPALAQIPGPAVSLAPGQSASFAVGPNGAPAATPERGRATWGPFELFAARHLAGVPVPDQPVPNGAPIPQGNGAPVEPAVAPDRLRVQLFDVAGQATLLVIDNGYGEALVYQARMTRDGAERATDVCLVVPRRHGIEYWPHRIDRLELANFRFVRWQPGDPIPCA